MQEKIKVLSHENISQRKEIEEEAWMKIEELKDKNKEDLTFQISKGIKDKAALQEVMSKYKTAFEKRDEMLSKITQLSDRSRSHEQKIRDLQNQIEAQKSEKEDRITTIEDKEARIIELKKKTQELEKFKFVLDYKIKELKRDIGPSKDNIQFLHEQVNKMAIEVKHFQRISDNLDLIVKDMKLRHKGLEEENSKCQIKLDRQALEKKRFREDVREVVTNIGDFKKLKKGVIKLYKTYVLEETVRQNAAQDNSSNGHSMKGYKETQLDFLRGKLTQEETLHRDVNQRFMKDQVEILDIINEKRKQYHELKMNIAICKAYTPEVNTGNATNEQLRQLEHLDYQIEKYRNELGELEDDENQM